MNVREKFTNILSNLFYMLILLLIVILALVFVSDTNGNKNELSKYDYYKVLQLKKLYPKCSSGIETIETSLSNDNTITGNEYKRIIQSFSYCKKSYKNIKILDIKEQLLNN